MSRDLSAVHLGAAGSPTDATDGAHERMQSGRDAIRKVAQAMATSMDLESSQVQKPPPPSSKLDDSSQLNRFRREEDIEIRNVAKPCVTTSAHDPSRIPVDAVSEGNNHDPSKRSNYIIRMLREAFIAVGGLTLP